MESLGDDMLLFISDKIHNVRDRKSFYRVSKQILKVACVRLWKLDIGLVEFLKDILPASPNMLNFKFNKRLSNTYMELLAQSCPNLQQLILSLVEEIDPHKEDNDKVSEFEFDFDDDGLCVVANACSRLNEVDLSGRLRVTEVGVAFLVRSCKNLNNLNISGCASVTNDILPASSNVHNFKYNKCLSNTYMELLARSCPNLQQLRLSLVEEIDHKKDNEASEFEFDFDDDGLCVMANACSRLNEVDLSGRLRVGDVGVAFLVRSCKDLTYLNISGCASVTNESFKAIGEIKSLRHLRLGGCLISDLGLEYMVEGNLKNCLQKFHMDKCENVSDNGISCLKLMNKLTDLKLLNCGVNITNSGIVSISQIPIIKHLNVSWLINRGHVSSSHIAGNYCVAPSRVSLGSCKAITRREAVLCFSHHRTLKSLVLFSCHNISWEDVKLVASTTHLIYMGLSRRIKTPMPKEAIQQSLLRDRSVIIIWK